jgi:hypothetical protein
MYLLEEYPLADIVTFVAKYNQASCATGSSSTSSPPTRSRLWPPPTADPGPRLPEFRHGAPWRVMISFGPLGPCFGRCPAASPPNSSGRRNLRNCQFGWFRGAGGGISAVSSARPGRRRNCQTAADDKPPPRRPRLSRLRRRTCPAGATCRTLPTSVHGQGRGSPRRSS